MKATDRVSVPAKSYRDLRAWQEAIKLSSALVPVCDWLAAVGRRRLAEQLESSATSVHANVAEGWGRTGRADRLRFFGFAWASLHEVESQLVEAGRLPRAPDGTVSAAHLHVRHTARLLAALRRRL